MQKRGGIQFFTIYGEFYHLQKKIICCCDISVVPTPEFLKKKIEKLDTMIRTYGNFFINIYTTVREQIDRARAFTFFMQIVLNPRFQLVMETGSDKKRTNLPTVLEIAAFIPDEYENRNFRDIVIAERREKSQKNCFIPSTIRIQRIFRYITFFFHKKIRVGIKFIIP